MLDVIKQLMVRKKCSIFDSENCIRFPIESATSALPGNLSKKKNKFRIFFIQTRYINMVNSFGEVETSNRSLLLKIHIQNEFLITTKYSKSNRRVKEVSNSPMN